MISGEFDPANLDLGAFLDLENENDGVTGSNALVLRSDFRELVAVLPKQFFQDDFRFFDFRGVELAFDAQADLAFLETVENVRFGDGVDAVIADAANLRAFFDFKDDDLTVGPARRVFDVELHVFKKLRVPKGLEIATQRLFVVVIAFTAEDARHQCVFTHPAIAQEIDAVDDKLRLRGGLRIRRGMILYNVLPGRVIKGGGEKVGICGCRGVRMEIFARRSV